MLMTLAQDSMTTAPQQTDISLSSHPLLSKLTQYQLLPQLIKELVIDGAIAHIPLSDAESQSAIESFCQSQQITSPETQQAWLTHFRMTPAQLEQQAIRLLKLEHFKQQQWGSKVEPLFLAQKQQFDQITYSLLRTDRAEVAQELFFRLQDEEQTFAELVTEYSQGPEAQTGGLIGPIEVARLHPTLAQLLTQRRPGQLCPPIKIEQWYVIARLEQYLPAALTPELRQKLIDHQFQEWMRAQVSNFELSTLDSTEPDLSPTPVRAAIA
jgi:parvulin-like peptidyl-prolyl isomerase